jgi:hypothetical protein
MLNFVYKKFLTSGSIYNSTAPPMLKLNGVCTQHTLALLEVSPCAKPPRGIPMIQGLPDDLYRRPPKFSPY